MNTMSVSLPVLLLTGYLGSGKTTLLNRILSNRKGIRFAVIVNDIGEVNIDASLIRKGGIVGQNGADDLVSLQNGCICCTLRADLIAQIQGLIDAGEFDYIVIEASGICEPEPIARTICAMSRQAMENKVTGPRLDCIVTVVDALRMLTDFEGGKALAASDIDDEQIEDLVVRQIEFCNLVLLNKISEVSPEQADKIRAVVRALQPKARIIGCDYCDVPLENLLDTGLFDFEKTVTAATWVQELERPVTEEQEEEAHHGHRHHHCHEHEHEHCHHHHHHGQGEAEEYGIGTFVYYRRQPFDFNKFDYYCASRWPKNIIRTKGVLYFSHNTDMSLLFEQAGVQKHVSEAGQWYATAPEEDRERLMEMDPDFARDWDPVFGDRMIKLVFIGQDIDREALSRDLDAMLVTDYMPAAAASPTAGI